MNVANLDATRDTDSCSDLASSLFPTPYPFHNSISVQICYEITGNGLNSMVLLVREAVAPRFSEVGISLSFARPPTQPLASEKSYQRQLSYSSRRTLS